MGLRVGVYHSHFLIGESDQNDTRIPGATWETFFSKEVFGFLGRAITFAWASEICGRFSSRGRLYHPMQYLVGRKFRIA